MKYEITYPGYGFHFRLAEYKSKSYDGIIGGSFKFLLGKLIEIMEEDDSVFLCTTDKWYSLEKVKEFFELEEEPDKDCFYVF